MSSAFDHSYPWDQLITRFKFRGQPELAGPFTQLMAMRREPVAPETAPIDALLPVPLAVARLRERGYNQAWELAHRLAPARGVRAQAHWLSRPLDGIHQAALDRASRRHQVRDAFALTPAGRAGIADRQVLLVDDVDDVMTTGATLDAAASLLRHEGAAGVRAWVPGRTPADSS